MKTIQFRQLLSKPGNGIKNGSFEFGKMLDIDNPNSHIETLFSKTNRVVFGRGTWSVSKHNLLKFKLELQFDEPLAVPF